MRRVLTVAPAMILLLTLGGCGSKVGPRVDSIEARMTEHQRLTQERIENQGRQVEALNQRLAELNTRFTALDRQLATQAETLTEVSDYLERYDATWNTFSRLQTEYDNELQKIRDQQIAASNSLTEARNALDANIRSVSTEMLSMRNDLRQRIDRTNGDVFSLREQSKEKLDDMSAALNTFGKAVQEMLTLQRSQFQGMTDAYSSSLADIEPYLPEAMLSTINTPELLVSPNPDVQPSSPQDPQ